MPNCLSSPGWQHACLPWPSLSLRVCSNSSPLSQWCYLTISSFAAPFSFCLQYFPVSGSFPMNWLFVSHGQSIGASTSVSVLSMNIQGWFPLGLTGLISLLSKGLSRVFSSATNQKHQFFGTQPSLWFSWLVHCFSVSKLDLILSNVIKDCLKFFTDFRIKSRLSGLSALMWFAWFSHLILCTLS